MRIDVMTRLRDLPSFDVLWSRRTTITDADGEVFELVSIEDLVQAKKTQREKDGPMIDALVESHYKAFGDQPTAERIKFWLSESRTAERLKELSQRFPEDAKTFSARRPLLRLASGQEMTALRAQLYAEMQAEQEKDRAIGRR